MLTSNSYALGLKKISDIQLQSTIYCPIYYFTQMCFIYLAYHTVNKSGVKGLNTLGHLDQYMAQHGRNVKQSYCETV